jgi:replicative superfamily II helicase
VWATFGNERVANDVKRVFMGQFPRVRQFFQWQIDFMMSRPVSAGQQNVVYNLPTSAGKTLLAQLFLLRACVLRQCKALLVLPYRAVVDEVFQSLSTMGAGLGVHVEAFYSARGTVPLMHGPMICVATIERAVGIIASLVEDDRLTELGAVVLDEVHFVGDADRGSALELLISRLVFHNKMLAADKVVDAGTLSGSQRSRRTPVQLVGFTATLAPASLQAFALWLQASAIGDGASSSSSSRALAQRPVQLNLFVTSPADLSRNAKGVDEVVHNSRGEAERRVPRLPHESKFEVQQNDRFKTKVHRIAPLVVETAECDGGTIVFVPAKSACVDVARHLASLLEHNAPSKQLAARSARSAPARQLLIQRLTSTEDDDGAAFNNFPFEAFITHGVGIHNADLTSDQRTMIEQAFLESALHTLVATTTLAAGVNLPARRVIVLSRKIGDRAFEPSRFRQMVGRAGRAGFDVTGDAFLVADALDTEVDQCLQLVRKDLEPTQSQLLNDKSGIERLILSALALLKGRAPRAELIRALESTLLKLQMRAGGATDRQLIHRTLRTLLDRQMVLMNERATELAADAADADLAPLDDDVVTITRLGQACERVGYDPPTAQLLLEDALHQSKALRVVDLLHLCFLATPLAWRDDLSTREWNTFATVLTKVREENSRRHVPHARMLDSRGANAAAARDDAGAHIEEVSRVQAMWDDAFLQHVGVDPNYVEDRTDSFSRKRDAIDAARCALTPHGVAVRFHGALLIREVMSENSSRVIAEALLDSFRSAPIIDELVRNAAAFSARLFVFLSHFTEFALLCTILGPFVARLAHGGARNDLHALVAVRGVGVQRARVLFDRNVRTAAQLADLTEDKLIEILGARLGPPEVRAATARSLLQAAKRTVEFERVRAAAANAVNAAVAVAAIGPTALTDPAGAASSSGANMPPPPPPQSQPQSQSQSVRKRNLSGMSASQQQQPKFF